MDTVSEVHVNRKMKATFLFGVIVVVAVNISAAVFTDFTTIDSSSETATGTLNGVSVVLECTRAQTRPGSGDNGGVVAGVADGSSGVFALPVFTPSLTLGDNIVLGATSDFRITFTPPVSNITIHLSQLQANLLSFTSGSVPIAFTLLSSDGDFTSSAGNTAIQGSPGGGDDASGSLLFSGVFNEISWVSQPGVGTTISTPDDGVWLQLSVATETQPQLNIARLGVQLIQMSWNTNHSGFTLESAPALPAANWEPTTNGVVIVGQEFSVAVDANDAQRFFRLRKN